MGEVMRVHKPPHFCTVSRQVWQQTFNLNGEGSSPSRCTVFKKGNKHANLLANTW